MSDPFDTLGVDARFDLDEKALEERHRALSGTLHPDRFVGRPAAERRMALDRAITVNTAWRALRDPVQRAEWLFTRAGIATGELQEPKPSTELLMEMLEVREELAEAREKTDLERIGKLGERMRTKERAVIALLREGFAKADGDEPRLRAMVPALGELRYVRRFFEELDAIEEQLTE